MEAPFKQIDWHPEILPPQAGKALAFLSHQKWLKHSPWYLAGGTALALQAGHRRSNDLDFFTQKSGFSNSALLRRQPASWYGTIRVLNPLDLAVMKVVTISHRGRKRDFIDLYWCAKHVEPLDKIILRLKTQYPTVAHNYHHILKSLVYFSDAEDDPIPQLFSDISWMEVKRFFKKEIPVITNTVLKFG